MEPANLTPPDDAQLEILLRSTRRELPDDGFSARVIAALPPAAVRTAPFIHRPLARNVAFSLAALAGLALAIDRGLSLDALRAFVSATQQLTGDASTSSASQIAVAFSIAALSFLYAMKDRLLRFR